jgi:hypothetical protein
MLAPDSPAMFSSDWPTVTNRLSMGRARGPWPEVRPGPTLKVRGPGQIFGGLALNWRAKVQVEGFPFNVLGIQNGKIVRKIVRTRLAGVRLGAGSRVRCPNLNLHLQVRFRHPANPNTNKRFRFKRFGSGSHPVRCQKMLTFC